MTGQNSSGTGGRSDERARLAAVDRHARAGHKARLLGRQEDDNSRDLFGASESAQRQFVLDKSEIDFLEADYPFGEDYES